MRAVNHYHRRVCDELGRRGLQYQEDYPIGQFLVDIYLPELNRIVEVDGPGHMRGYDERRTAKLSELRPELEMVRVKVGLPMEQALERILDGYV